MQYSLSEVLVLTVVSMLIVFIILLGIMLMMMLLGKLFGGTKVSKTTSNTVIEPPAKNDSAADTALIETDPLAKVAVLAALAEASEAKDGRRFEVAAVKRIK
ncbi:OadG family transporter subunit [Agrilactobacillus yilanensis]|uniref:OadG family transporter subunit n=1 Tax=Agrilactobacillus yilanensis TaxID=2485997 RepID=A0ABW4J8U8_9LACO|nr:OadG family transporter subunit [Agrilactobacillus yilanensis]